MAALFSLTADRSQAKKSDREIRFALLFEYIKCQHQRRKVLTYFWWCWSRLKACTINHCCETKRLARPQVDVFILEVGLGGKFDDTNVARTPTVCGITSLGYDHVEILGNTLREIAEQKAGIFQSGVPAFTVSQPDEAMRALEEKASQLNVQLQVIPPLGANLLNGLHLGLDGDHQYLNAGLAVALCSTWLQRTGHSEANYMDQRILCLRNSSKASQRLLARASPDCPQSFC